MEGRKLIAFTVIQIVGAGFAFWILMKFPTPWNAQRYLGTALALVGISGIAIARYQLGRSFSIRAEAHQLVTWGLYSRIRNPIYVFGVVMITGFLLVVQRPALWIILAVVIFGQAARARREARVLEAAFGDAYREYRQKTWF